jgi:DNA-directed RNA polymerase subunit K/omega
MLNPNIGKLIKTYDNRYRLVLDVANTAREISEKIEESGEISTCKPVSVAIDTLANKGE